MGTAVKQADVVTNHIVISPGRALWNQRGTIAELGERLKALIAAVGRPTDLNPYQWAGFAAFALEFRPDLIVELGRGLGNSTCCFIEVANRLGGANACRVLSLCLSDDWFARTVPRLNDVVPFDWFSPAQIEVANILEYDLTPELAKSKRCLILWDAHGFDMAEWVLCKVLPQLLGKPHLVLMHDMSDTRFEIPSPEYGETGIWKGTNATAPSFWLGNVFSRVAQAISMVDFTSRNRLPLHSAAESLHTEIASDPNKMETLRGLLGEELFSLQAHWYWFTLNEASTTLFFPPYTSMKADARKAEPQVQSDQGESQFAQLKEAANQLSQQDLDHLIDSLKTHGRELAEMPLEKQRLEALWQQVQSSAGWRLLNAWRTLRDSALPENTQRRRAYESMLGHFRGIRSHNKAINS